ncbi:hypothetical protein QJS10_CPA08g00891 [Acorus calamus]|uniref:Uncharacterized protein n=1 Tax=Acorus calamus TaxID=4465 RepID=A0AAV9E9L5_ACOCL|nr:hypothetical protein QJS10_CPA08g00891 [Acorus calamus]
MTLHPVSEPGEQSRILITPCARRFDDDPGDVRALRGQAVDLMKSRDKDVRLAENDQSNWELHEGKQTKSGTR